MSFQILNDTNIIQVYRQYSILNCEWIWMECMRDSFAGYKPKKTLTLYSNHGFNGWMIRLWLTVIKLTGNKIVPRYFRAIGRLRIWVEHVERDCGDFKEHIYKNIYLIIPHSGSSEHWWKIIKWFPNFGKGLLFCINLWVNITGHFIIIGHFINNRHNQFSNINGKVAFFSPDK